MTPLEITTGTVAVANGLFTVGSNFWKLLAVDDDLKICLRLLEMVARDIDYARQLRNRKFLYGSERDAEFLQRTNTVIKDLQNAALETGKLIEATRVHKSIKGSISVPRRFSWVFKGKDNFIAQQWTINAFHHRLLQSIATMENCPDAEIVATPPSYKEVELISPWQSRVFEGKSTTMIETSLEEPQERSDPLPSTHAVSQTLEEKFKIEESDELTEEDKINLRFLSQWQC